MTRLRGVQMRNEMAKAYADEMGKEVDEKKANAEELLKSVSDPSP